MVRPHRKRIVGFEPEVIYFKPAGVPLSELKEEILKIDELEALRLCDAEELKQDEAAKKMNVSQPTFFRILSEARKKIALAIVNGRAIKIQGGNYEMIQGRGQGLGQGMGFGRGQRGRMGGVGAGPGGVCKCPKCGYEQSQVRGQPCMNISCPKCGSKMMRS